jgi:molybdate transport system substrate-binding protein
MKKRVTAGIAAFMIALAALTGCKNEDVTVTVFAAKSLNGVLDELIERYSRENPKVVFETNYDSSGTLMTQIIEGGAKCDVFFSADEKQMDQLEKEGFIVEGTRKNVVNNQLCVVTYKGSDTKVTRLEDMNKAQSLAIASGSVPVGKYTRQALVKAGILPETKDVSKITSEEISEAFGGVSINECSNVGAVASAVAEQSNEVGTVYYSDTFGYEDSLEIIEIVPYELTGDVIYPAAQIKNDEAGDACKEAAADFISFLTSKEAKEVFEEYHFDEPRD